ncbi:hypothetical protein DNTS_018376 [Danionella cerebrum]|uniref:Uncharacterized protein n=1 Tax=Danionella cerebrum TaxID=2873325 RepID=A0A553R059_9TELE|nr:hypothetical protein DNTS_018376 [Danionella translucida]
MFKLIYSFSEICFLSFPEEVGYTHRNSSRGGCEQKQQSMRDSVRSKMQTYKDRLDEVKQQLLQSHGAPRNMWKAEAFNIYPT